MSNLPTVSVILTSYNHEKFIPDAIKGILAQDYTNFELIIIDDKSKDDSLEVIEKFQDARIKLIPNIKNLGMAPRVNQGIKLARGKYIAHMNSDDVWTDTTKLSKQVEFLENNPEFGAVFTRAIVVDGKNNVKPNTLFHTEGKNQSRHEWLKHFFYRGNCLCYPTAMIRKEVFEKVGFYDCRYSVLLDFDMWLRILISGYEIHVLDLPTINFRDDVCSHSFNERAIGSFEFSIVMDNYLKISYLDFQKIFQFEDKNITADNYLAFLLKSCFHLDSHDKLALKRLYDVMHKKDYPEIDLSYKLFIKMIKDDLKNHQLIKTSGKPTGVRKMLKFPQYLSYKNSKEKYHIFMNPLKQLSYFIAKHKHD